MKLFKRVPTSGIQYTQDAESYLVVGRFTQIWNTQEGCWFLVTVAPSDPFSLNRDGTTMGPMSWGELKAKIGWKEVLIARTVDFFGFGWLAKWQLKRNATRVLATVNLQPIEKYFGEANEE